MPPDQDPGQDPRASVGHADGRRGRSCFLGGVLVVLSSLGLLGGGAAAAADLPESLNLRGYPTGEKPPDFRGRTPEGQTVSLADLRGKVVIVNFWATWCLECRPEMPMFEQLHRDLARKGLATLGINVREGDKVIRAYAKELGLTFHLVLDPKGEIARSYGVIGLPTTFLVGRDGRAVARAIGPREWASAPARALIQALLAEQVPRKDAQ